MKQYMGTRVVYCTDVCTIEKLNLQLLDGQCTGLHFHCSPAPSVVEFLGQRLLFSPQLLFQGCSLAWFLASKHSLVLSYINQLTSVHNPYVYGDHPSQFSEDRSENALQTLCPETRLKFSSIIQMNSSFIRPKWQSCYLAH
jgi:hypothetical protein